MAASYYDILGVSPDAPAEAIKSAYRQRVKQLHPDVNGPGGRERLDAVMQAYRILGSPEARARYDAALRGPAAPLTALPGLRQALQRLREFFAAHPAPAAPAPATDAAAGSGPPRPAESFDRAFTTASSRPTSPYVRGADGVIRRIVPSSPLPDVRPAGPGRPEAPQRTPLPKHNPWKLW